VPPIQWIAEGADAATADQWKEGRELGVGLHVGSNCSFMLDACGRYYMAFSRVVVFIWQFSQDVAVFEK
jgi:hypothetical protein